MTGTVILAASVFGMKALDDEHLGIDADIEKLSNLLDGAAYEFEPVETAFGELIALLETHFHHEEAWMEGFAYPGSGTHKKQHRKLLQTLKEQLAAFSANPTHSQAQEFFSLAKDWLTYHTVHSDRVVAQYALQRRHL